MCTVYLPCIKILNISPQKVCFTTPLIFCIILFCDLKCVYFQYPHQKRKNLWWEWKQQNTYLAAFTKSFKTAFILPCHFFNCQIMFSMHKFYIFSAYPYRNVLTWTTLWLLTDGMHLTVTKQAVFIKVCRGHRYPAEFGADHGQKTCVGNWIVAAVNNLFSLHKNEGNYIQM